MAAKQLDELFDSDIEYAVQEYGDHRGVTRAKVIRWLKQFPPTGRRLAAKILQSIDYYADSNINAMARQLAKVTYQEYSDGKKGKVYFVPIGAPGSGAQQVARHLQSMRIVPNGRVIDLLQLTRDPPTDVRVIVAFDDFSGTGQTIQDWWELNESIILPIEAELVIGILVLNGRVRELLEEITEQVIAVEELYSTQDVFHASCDKLSNREKTSLLRLCKVSVHRLGNNDGAACFEKCAATALVK